MNKDSHNREQTTAFRRALNNLWSLRDRSEFTFFFLELGPSTHQHANSLNMDKAVGVLPSTELV